MKRRLAGLLLAFATRLPAADEVLYPHAAATAGAPDGAGGSPAWSAAVAVVVLAGAGAWLLWQRRRGPGRAAGLRNLSVAETRPLGNRQYLVVAAYGEEKFLIGVCPGQLNLLAKLGPAKAGEVP